MLKSLKIKNVALIDEADIGFSSGLNILSGETGSGKSVIIDALNFVLGAKADKTMITYGQPSCSVCAEFDITDNIAVKNAAEELSLDCDDDVLIINRRFFADGKGDIKVNGNAVTAGMLKKLTFLLVDIHGQSEHFYLLKESNQLDAIDNFCGDKLTEIKERIKSVYGGYKAVLDALENLGGDESSRAVKLDILAFQIDEIEKADLKEGEEEELIALRKKLLNQEKIISAVSGAAEALNGEGGATDTLQSALHALRSVAAFGVEYEALSERLDSARCEIEDIYETLSGMSSEDFDEGWLEETEERLELIKKLKNKYGGSIGEIYEYLEKSRAEYDRLLHFDELSVTYRKQKAEIEEKLHSLYKEMRVLREKAASEFSESVVRELSELGMVRALFEIGFSEFPEMDKCDFNSVGPDKLEFMFSANAGEPLKPLAKIISGGEISRFMLAVKTAAKTHAVSTFVFDEIDAGISGKIAAIVAEKFAKIAKNVQVLAITHLPQISAMGDNSLLIYKTEEDGRTRTHVKTLTREDKVKEITRLVGGDENSHAAKEHAAEMIARAEEYKKAL